MSLLRHFCTERSRSSPVRLCRLHSFSALSPPTCYPDSYARFKIAGAFVIAPFFALHVVPAWMVARGATFAFGVGMWGQPLLIWAGKKGLEYLPENWPELVDIRK